MRKLSYYAVVLSTAAAALFLGGGCTTFPEAGSTFIKKYVIEGHDDSFCYCINDGEGGYQIACWDTYALVGFTDGYTVPGEYFSDPDCTHSSDEYGNTGPNSNKTSDPFSAFSSDLPNSVKAQADGAKKPAESLPGAASNSTTFGLDPYVRPLPLVPGLPVSALQNFQPQCDPTASFYKTNHSSSSVSHIATCPFALISSISVTSNPLQLALTPDHTTLLVTSYDNAITFIDTATDKVTFTLTTPNLYPSGIAITPDGTLAYVTNYFDTGTSLMVVDIANRTIRSQIPLPVNYPKHVYLTPDGSQAWVNYDQGSQVTIIDTLTNTIANTLGVAGVAYTGMAFNNTGTRAYIALYGGNLAVYDTSTLALVTTIPVGPWPVDVSFNLDGTFIIVDSYDSQGVLTAIDPSTNLVLNSLKTGHPTSCLAVQPSKAN